MSRKSGLERPRVSRGATHFLDENAEAKARRRGDSPKTIWELHFLLLLSAVCVWGHCPGKSEEGGNLPATRQATDKNICYVLRLKLGLF